MVAFGQGAPMGGGSSWSVSSINPANYSDYADYQIAAYKAGQSAVDKGAFDAAHRGSSPAAGGAGGTSGTISGTGGTSVSPIGTVPGLNTQLDPWGTYRGGAAVKLNQFMQGQDPAKQYQDKLQQMMMGTFSPSDPSYMWRLGQGAQAVERSLASRGMLDSGGAVSEIMQFGQGMASQEYSAQFNRLIQGMQATEGMYQNQFTRLAELAGINISPIAAANVGLEAQRLATTTGLEQQRIDLAKSGQGLDWAKYGSSLLQQQQQQAGMAQALQDAQFNVPTLPGVDTMDTSSFGVY